VNEHRISSLGRRGGLRRVLTAGAAAAVVLAGLGGPAIAASGASVLPPEWHIHDGQTGLGPQHKGIGFFPTVLGETTSQYLADPASCPNATDKAFLPSFGDSSSEVLRAGVCMTSSATIQLRTVRLGVSGPEGWSALSGTDGGGYVTYYQVTPR
jgi:hypothetical protein